MVGDTPVGEMELIDTQTRQEVRQGFADGTYHNPGYSLPCPGCGKSTTIFEEGSQWYCWNCKSEFRQEDVVLSYRDGTEEVDELARLLKELDELGRELENLRR